MINKEVKVSLQAENMKAEKLTKKIEDLFVGQTYFAISIALQVLSNKTEFEDPNSWGLAKKATDHAHKVLMAIKK